MKIASSIISILQFVLIILIFVKLGVIAGLATIIHTILGITIVVIQNYMKKQ